MRVEPVVRYDMLRSGKNKYMYFIKDMLGNIIIDNDFAKDHIWSVGLNTALYFNL